mgnify:CR=1 FL=1
MINKRAKLALKKEEMLMGIFLKERRDMKIYVVYITCLACKLKQQDIQNLVTQPRNIYLFFKIINVELRSRPLLVGH